MTSCRNTLLVLGTLILALAGGPALGATTNDCGPGCEATCDTNGCATCGNPDAACTQDGGCDGCRRWWRDEPFFQECRGYCNDFCDICRGCTFKADADVLIMQRSTPGSRTVLTDATTNADLFGGSNLFFPVAAGPRVSLMALDCEGWGFEVNYFGIDGWSAVNDVSATALPNGGNLAVDSAEQVFLTTAHFESTARLYSTELNFRKPLICDISLLAGFRWADLTDRYFASGINQDNLTSSETITTRNHMFGFQMGADGILWKQADCWKITGFVKGGIFCNNAHQGTTLSDPGPNGLGDQAASNSNNVAAFFGEAGIKGYIQFTKHLSASGGYQVIFINNVAQPINQLGGTDLANSAGVVDTSAGLFYHGATVGLEVTW
jgi:hypothetical protein